MEKLRIEGGASFSINLSDRQLLAILREHCDSTIPDDVRITVSGTVLSSLSLVWQDKSKAPKIACEITAIPTPQTKS